MKRVSCWSLALMASLLGGCLQVEDELTLQPDGSGAVKLLVKTAVPAEMEEMMGFSSRAGGGSGAMYPPTSEAEAKQFFPAKDFTVTTKESGESDQRTITIEAAFKDVNALLKSPYGHAHQLSLKLDGAALKLRALSGGEAVARAAEFKAEGEMSAYLEMPGASDLQKKKDEMKFKFRVTLPNAVTEANGARDGKSATWDIERAKCKDADEFASKLGGVLEARCDATGLKFTPQTPPRLGLDHFKELAAGIMASAGALPDTNKIAAAAKFVPYALRVTRAMDLSGEGGVDRSHAELTGAVVLPSELAPQKWGAPRLEEAVDTKGKSLKPKGDEDDMFGRFSRFSGFGASNEDEEAEDASESKKSDEARRDVTLAFAAPEWKVKEIARVKGSVALQYLGGSEVIKLSNAVPANAIMDMTKRSSFSSFGQDSERGLLNDPRLTALDLSVRVQMAMVQGSMTMISLEAGGGKASLVDLQVFDADGRPWPTTMPSSDSGGEERTYQVMVAGKPKGPLSLALLVSGVGASVEVPILVEKISLGGK